jgi:hypothetical protein
MKFNCTRLLVTFATQGLSGAECVDVCQILPACLKELSAKAIHLQMLTTTVRAGRARAIRMV